MAKKKVTKKTTKKKVDVSPKTLKKESLMTGKLLIYSAIICIVSLVIAKAGQSNLTLSGVFGLITILSFALVLLGIVVELVLYFLKKKDKKKK